MIEIVVKGQNSSGSALKDAAADVEAVGEAGAKSEGKLKGFFGVMGGAGLGGVLAVGAGLGAVAATGLNFNNSMEQARARINAFTKDAGKTEEVLAMVTKRAAETPFAFEDMAAAAAGLGPAAAASGVPLEQLIEKAEILAASNPAEGLEGGVVAIKEALSGDFTSAIERFNLSRQYINDLRAQGVPDLEALGMAMQQAGYDTDLVSNLANTAEGRWSTFMDTWTVLAGMVTQPIFDAVSQGLGTANTLLTDLSPIMQQAAASAAGFIGQMIAGQGPINGVLAALQPVVGFLQANWQPIVAAAGAILAFAIGGAVATAMAALGAFLVAAAPVIAIIGVIGVVAAALQQAWAQNFGGIQEKTAAAMTAIQTVVTAVLGVVQAFWAENGASIMATAQETWTQIQQIIGGVVAIIASVISTVFGGVASFLNEHGNEIQTVLKFAWDTIQNVIESTLNVIQGIINTVLGVITGDWETANQGIQQIVEGLTGFIGTQFENLKALIAGLGPGFMSAATGIGQSIIDGMVNSIKGGISSVLNAARDMAQAALNAAMDVVKPGSPSKVFTALGLTIPQGLAMGIRQGGPLVADSAATMARGGVEAARNETRTVNVGGITINQNRGDRDDQITDRLMSKLQGAAGLIR